MAVLVFTDRLARRFLPLSMLLRMALVFPDQAPSRFGSALRYGTAKQLLNRNPPTSQALMSLVQAISHHDRATRGHSERVRAYSQLIGQELKLDAKDMDRLSWAALLHDVGKLDVSPAILNKRGRPDEVEWDELRKHPANAPAYLKGFEHWMGDWSRAASEHHERWDGKGYPAGLAGTEIHQAGRIVSVADAYDVMTSVRSYKKSMPTGVARQEIERNAGEQFDPATVRAFLNVGIGQVNTKWGGLRLGHTDPRHGQSCSGRRVGGGPRCRRVDGHHRPRTRPFDRPRASGRNRRSSSDADADADTWSGEHGQPDSDNHTDPDADGNAFGRR